MLQEMESVLTKARMFKDKPDGDVTHINRRDKNGVPIPVFQDPMHYPHQTMFLAPGKPACLWHTLVFSHQVWQSIQDMQTLRTSDNLARKASKS
jgi:hypothetical protein